MTKNITINWDVFPETQLVHCSQSWLFEAIAVVPDLAVYLLCLYGVLCVLQKTLGTLRDILMHVRCIVVLLKTKQLPSEVKSVKADKKVLPLQFSLGSASIPLGCVSINFDASVTFNIKIGDE